MRGGHVFVVLLASALAIEDDERDALGAPGPTRANLRGRGLKFGHFATDDAPAPSPTETPSQVPAPAPTPAAAGTPAFLDSQDCADCPGCIEVSQQGAYAYSFDFRDSPECICYAGAAPYLDQLEHKAYFSGSEFNDCIAITGPAPGNPDGVFSDFKYLGIYGEGGDDLIVAVDYDGVAFYGGDGTDFCIGGNDNYKDCEYG